MKALLIGSGPSRSCYAGAAGYDAVVSVNMGSMGIAMPSAVVTLHGHRGIQWNPVREWVRYGIDDGVHVVSHWQQDNLYHDRVDEVVRYDDMNGTSGLLAALWCLDNGYDVVEMIGCDMTDDYGSQSKLDCWRRWSCRLSGRVVPLYGNLIGILA